MALSDLEERIESLARWMLEARYLVVFTGAGISTESGLPDFRGPEGRLLSSFAGKKRDIACIIELYLRDQQPESGYTQYCKLY